MERNGTFDLNQPVKKAHEGDRGSHDARTRSSVPGGTRLAAAVVLIALVAGSAGAATQYVSNTGIDGPGCGPEGAPCRTISQAIDVASEGDRILVLPGVYGDVDGDGAFVTPGDEPAEPEPGCRCMVHVDKSVAILSRDGAAATIVRGALDGLVSFYVAADRVTIGARKRGFTITGDVQHDGYGVRAFDTANLRVEGNLFSRLVSAVHVTGRGGFVKANRIGQVFTQGIHVDGSSMRVKGNVVEQTGSRQHDSAIHVVGGAGGGGHRVERNLVLGNNGVGIFVDNGSADGATQGTDVTGNLVVGNAASGIKVVLAPEGGAARINGNSIYGNDAGANCGLMSLSAGPAVSATGNYWGGPAGPGQDPRDDVCAVGTLPDVGAPSSTEIVVVAPPLR